MTETPLNRLAVLGVLAGIGTGLLVAALNRAIVTTERLVYGVDHLKALDPGSQVTPLRLAITLVVVGIITSWSWYLLNRFGRPAVSVPGTMNGTPMPLWETLCSVFLQVISVAAGAPVGRENAPRVAGGLSASWIATTFKLDPQARRILIASAAGAGRAAKITTAIRHQQLLVKRRQNAAHKSNPAFEKRSGVVFTLAHYGRI